MKHHSLFAFLFLLSVVGLAQCLVYRRHLGPPLDEVANPRAALPEWDTIEQLVDHYNPTDLRTWSMRFLRNDQFFEEGGPILIYLGGEWTISQGSLMAGQIYDLAKALNGIMFYTEHRYYGKSYPTEDFSTDNLRYLSVDQALEDVAYFIENQKSTNQSLANSKVVVIGGSYSATMATWARLKYPHLIDVGYASSAPLRAVADFFEYYEVVQHNLGLASEECVNVIKEGVELTEEFLKNETGRTYVSELYDTCETLTNDEPERAFFFNTIAEVFAGHVQYAAVGELEKECNTLLGYEGNSLEKLAKYVKSHMGGQCMGTYEDFLEEYGSTNLTTDAYRQWLYQSCTEFGFFQTTASNTQPFGNTFPLKLFTQICVDLYGEKVTAKVLDTSVERTNIIYGSLLPEVTKVISVHGSVDPWHALGVLEDLSDTSVSIFVNGSSHCQDLSSEKDSDIEELKAAKSKAKQLIIEWISN